MEDDPREQAESLLPYERWIANALRHVVVQAVEHVAVHGLPGNHHFYISFRTDFPGVVIPPHLRAQYPQEMTIVIQHQFWDLKLNHETRAIQVGLSFGGVGSTLVIPLDSLVSFADPQIRYALRFEPIEPKPKTTALAPVPVQPEAETRKQRHKRRRSSVWTPSGAARRPRLDRGEDLGGGTGHGPALAARASRQLSGEVHHECPCL